MMDPLFTLASLLLLFRALGALLVLPVEWGQFSLSQRISVAAVLVLAVPSPGSPAIECTLAILAGELVVGVILALPAVIVVEVAGMIGELFDGARGQTQAVSVDPVNHEVLPTSAALVRAAVIALLFLSGYILVLVESLHRSTEVVPLGALAGAMLAKQGALLLPWLVEMLGVGLSVALPLLLITLLVDFGLVILTKISGGVSLNGEALVAKTVAGFLMVATVLAWGGVGEGRLLEAALPTVELLAPTAISRGVPYG